MISFAPPTEYITSLLSEGTCGIVHIAVWTRLMKFKPITLTATLQLNYQQGYISVKLIVR